MSGLKIPFTGIQRQYASLRKELLDTADDVWSSGQVLDGKYTYAFESVIAERTGRKYAIAVNSGTQALIFALRSLNLGYQKLVGIPALSFIATSNAVLEAGLVPFVLDVDANGQVDLASESDTQAPLDALMYVNLYGNMIDYDRLTVIMQFFGGLNLPVIEDAAQSFGAKYNGKPSGSFGDISVFSFDPMKNFNNYGSGGMLLTDEYEIYHEVTDLRNNGKPGRYYRSGTNSKMSELDCACMLVKLNYFDAWQKRRTEIAEYWNEQFKGKIETLTIEESVEPSWHKYPIFVDDRAWMRFQLIDKGIDTRIHYEEPLSETVSYQTSVEGTNRYKQDPVKFLEYAVNAKRLSLRTLSLPIYPELTDAEVEYIATNVLKLRK